jgi:Cd2+/Zn2+-exporting ATPase
MIHKEYSVEGLGCANCAAKIEEEITNLPGVKAARLNFATQILKVDFNSPLDQTNTEELNRITGKIEPGTTIRDRNTLHPEEKPTALISLGKLARFLGAGLLFGGALLFPLPAPAVLALFISSYLLSGGDVILRAVKSVVRGRFFDENTLMTVATLGAWGIGESPEAVAVMLFYQLGELFQDAAVNRSRRSISALMDLKPDQARVKQQDGTTREMSPEEVTPGQIIVVRPGERVPLDGIILRGNGVVDTSALTGESLPRSFSEGDEILSGVICQDGLLEIEVTRPYKDSTVARIMALVEEAADRKAPVEGFITKFARIYTPAVFAGAALLFIIPALITGNGTTWFYRALVFLVISCPCALVVSIPLGIFAGLGAAGRRGILVKGGNYLDALAKVETVVFDKTGTLTEGRFTLKEVKTAPGENPDQVLSWLARAEHGSNHPLARAVKEAVSQETALNTGAFREHRGRGIEAELPEGRALAGSLTFLREQGIPDLPEDISESTVIYLALGERYRGSVEMADRIKEDAPQAVADLRSAGVSRIILLTGDTPEAAAPVAETLNIDEVRASLLPEDKVKALEELERAPGRRGLVLFCGDGINDAPVLTRADVGAAMGALGSDAAIEAADVVLMNDKPSRIAEGIAIARRTRRIVIQNIVLALTIKSLVLLLGALGAASLWAAVFADVGTALLAVMNALRIIFTGPQPKSR